MPRRAKGPRLYLDPKRRQWVIRDGSRFVRTGCGEGDGSGAEKSLAQYIGRKHKPNPSGSPIIADVLNAYGKEVAPYRNTAKNLGYVIANLLEYWGEKNVAEISAKACREYAAGKSQSSAGRCLKILRAAVNYWHKEYGPLAFIPSFDMPKADAPRERWLSRGEAARLLRAAHPYQHIRRFIVLGLYTGSRPGIILKLRWSQVDLRGCVMVRAVSQSKNKKAPPVKLGRRIMTHLRRWKKLDGDKEYICHFEDQWHPGPRRVADPHGAWAKVVEASGLEGVTRHTLRHTRATWLMQAGVPIWEAAGHLGMTTRTLETVYGKHSPNFQEHAANI